MSVRLQVSMDVVCVAASLGGGTGVTTAGGGAWLVEALRRLAGLRRDRDPAIGPSAAVIHGASASAGRCSLKMNVTFKLVSYNVCYVGQCRSDAEFARRREARRWRPRIRSDRVLRTLAALPLYTWTTSPRSRWTEDRRPTSPTTGIRRTRSTYDYSFK